jgi:hypothetical protein
MSLLKIKLSTELSDLQNDFSNGLTNLIYSEGRLMEFYTNFISGTASVTDFKYQVLSYSDAKAGRINVISETSISTGDLDESLKGSFYQLYYDGSNSTLTDILVRYNFTDNGVEYISEPFMIV